VASFQLRSQTTILAFIEELDDEEQTREEDLDGYLGIGGTVINCLFTLSPFFFFPFILFSIYSVEKYVTPM